MVNEIIFRVKESPEGGYEARALCESIFSEADDLENLRNNVRDAVHCHYDKGAESKVICLLFMKEEVIAL